MPLPTPKLDDRHFQDIVDEAKKRIPYYIKEWTDHNVSDPGVTMIELFAWMTDMLLYRLNQVPDLHYIKFMEMLGVKLKEPVPARAPVTFWLSAPQDVPVEIPAGTEVASTQTETQPSIVFTTNESFIIEPPQLTAVTSHIFGDNDDQEFTSHNIERLLKGQENVPIFSAAPREDDALYFGFDNDLSNYILGFELDCDPSGGAGINPNLPPYVWEASTGSRDAPWVECEQDPGEDTTKGLNIPGRIRMFLPPMGRSRFNNQNLYWVRLRIRRKRDEYNGKMQPYETTPRLRQITPQAWGGSTPATHALEVAMELLGTSDGSTGQIYQLQVTPILQRRPGETLVVRDGDHMEEWTEALNFAQSGANDPHYTLDSVTGELRLAPAIRQRDGSIKRYGRIPPRGARLYFRRYRTGGGLDGNVQVGKLNTLKTAIPFIALVKNRETAVGGLDAETLEDAMVRAPGLLRSQNRAVTEADFEFLARHVLRDTGWAQYRVKCLQPRPSRESRVIPGQVYVLIIPHIQNPRDRERPKPEHLVVEQDGIFAELLSYLDKRRLLTTRLDVRAPEYYWVASRVIIHAASGANHAQVQEDVLQRLYRFLNPLIGGTDGKGWPFGRDLVVSDVYQCLQDIPGVQYVRSVDLFRTTPGAGPHGDIQETIEVVGHGVIASGIHQVEFA